MVTEVYGAIPGAPWAIVSDRGSVLTSRRVGSGRPGHWREVGNVDRAGYPVVNFKETGPLRIHRLVAQVFIGPPPFEGAVVRHLNDVKTDNRVVNLAWGTHAENMADAIRLGEVRKRTHCKRGHLIADTYHRRCLVCREAAAERRKQVEIKTPPVSA